MKRMGKMIVLALVLCMAAGGFIFAGGEQEAAEGEKQLTIGFDAMNVSMTWMKFAHDAMVE